MSNPDLPFTNNVELGGFIKRAPHQVENDKLVIVLATVAIPSATSKSETWVDVKATGALGAALLEGVAGDYIALAGHFTSFKRRDGKPGFNVVADNLTIVARGEYDAGIVEDAPEKPTA